jgi:nitroreductase / dihydropteridine reductase
MDLLQQLNWRYATKGYDATKKLSPEQWAMVQDVLQLSPSSFGLQPYKFVVVENPELRAKLREHAFNQPQVTDASHFIVFCRIDGMDQAYVDRFIELNAKVRGAELASFDGLKQMISGFVGGLTPERFAPWADKQVYLALGNLLTSCAVMGIDASPMEGFDAAKFDEVLDLPARGLHAVVVCALGTRSPEDKYAMAKKVRYPKENLFLHLT